MRVLRLLYRKYEQLMEASRRKSLTYRLWLWAKRWFNERLTVPGRTVLMAACAMCLAGAFPEYTVGSFGFSLFVALALLSLATSVLRVPKIAVQRLLPERCIAGAAVPLRVTVTNPGPGDLSDVGAYEFRLPPGLSIIDPPRYTAVLPAGKSEPFVYQLATTQRGAYHLAGPTLLSPFPYGLTQSLRFHSQPHRLVVYPAFKPLQSFNVPLGARHQPGGIALLSQVGESMEFIGTREYRPGDRVRDLHPRTWARVGFPVVKQFQEEMLTRVAILLDTYIPTDSSRKEFEASLSITAAIADFLSQRDYVVDVFAAGPELFELQAGRSLAYLENILDILACVEPDDGDPLSKIAPRFMQQTAQLPTVVAVLLGWDEQRQKMIAELESRGVRVKPVFVSSHLRAADLSGAGPYAVVVTPEEVASGVPAL